MSFHPARNDDDSDDDHDHEDDGYLPESYKPPSYMPRMMTMNAQHRQSRSRRSDILSSSSSSSSDISTTSYDSDDSELLELQAAEREWEENMRQLQLAVSVLILPTIGKWLGRRWSYWLYAQYIKVGWKWSIFIPQSWLRGSST